MSEAIHWPEIIDGDHIGYRPVRLEVPVARLKVTIGNCEFVRGHMDSRWSLKDDDNLAGCRAFVNGVFFKELGYVTLDSASREECRQVSLKVISDLLNKVTPRDPFTRVAERIGDLMPRDHVLGRVEDKLSQLDYLGFTHDGYDWRGCGYDEKDSRIVMAEMCAMGLVESFDLEQVLSHVYVDMPEQSYSALIDKLHGSDDAIKMMSSCRRKISKKTKVRLLLSEQIISQLRRFIGPIASESLRMEINNLSMEFSKSIKRRHNKNDRVIEDNRFNNSLRRLFPDLMI